MAPSPPLSLPPACAECITTTQSAVPGSPPQNLAYTLSRASDGKMRIDYGTTSVITDPATAQTILLDHAAQEVRTIALPPVALPQLTPPIQTPGMPAVPAVPGAPTGPAMSVVDLGTRLIEGQEVQGKQYTMPPVAPPGMPNQPQFPTAPQPAALVSEVWMSTNLHLPVLTRITGAFGQQTCRCKTTALGEPPASLFQIPAGYKQVGAPPVSLPAPGPLTPPKPPSL